MPGVAKGVIFITLENAASPTWSRAGGRVQRGGGVTHVVSQRLDGLSELLASVVSAMTSPPSTAWAEATGRCIAAAGPRSAAERPLRKPPTEGTFTSKAFASAQASCPTSRPQA